MKISVQKLLRAKNVHCVDGYLHVASGKADLPWLLSLRFGYQLWFEYFFISVNLRKLSSFFNIETNEDKILFIPVTASYSKQENRALHPFVAADKVLDHFDFV